MINCNFAQTMARCNRWQNRSLYEAADALSDENRREDRGAFFKSIHATLNHILWADKMWLSRVSDISPPNAALRDSGVLYEDWEVLKQERFQFDERIIAWADHLDDAWLEDDLTWYSGAQKRDMAKPRWLVIVHIFNHQTHHRGQVHAMLTGAGAKPQDTDLLFM